MAEKGDLVYLSFPGDFASGRALETVSGKDPFGSFQDPPTGKISVGAGGLN
jgi:hypothetical protein